MTEDLFKHSAYTPTCGRGMPVPKPETREATRYVCGFLFRKNGEEVALIRKTRPEWQEGFLNGIGGHIEEGEATWAAMVREFKEETGATVGTWRPFCTISLPKAVIHFFVAHDFDGIKLSSPTDEKVDWYPVDLLSMVKVVPNLRWLVPLALSKPAYVAQVREASPLD